MAVLAAGVPNITGKTTIYDTVIGNIQRSLIGAFYPSYQTNSLGLECVDWRSGNFYRESFDASRSSAVYGKSDTVQPSALGMIWQYKF